MHYRLLLIISAMILILSSCSDTTEPNNEEFTVLDQKLFENFFANKIIKTTDSCLVMSGNDSSYVPTILKLGIDGNELWRGQGSAMGYNNTKSIIETSDKGFLIACESHNDSRLIKFDHEGNILWEKNIGASTSLKVSVDSEDNIILVDRFMIHKFDSLGNIIWYRIYSDGYEHTFSGTAFDVYSVYDSTVISNGDITIIYKSRICDLVRIIIDKDGNYVKGYHYYVRIQTNALIHEKWSYQYIFGVYEDMAQKTGMFLMSIYGIEWEGTSDTFGELEGFNDYMKSIRETESEDVIITSMNRNMIMNFDPFHKILNWVYYLDDLESYEYPRSYDTIEISLNQYATIVYVGRTDNETEFEGTILRFFQKN